MPRRLFIALPLLSGCAVATPFRSVPSAGEDTAIVAVTHAVLKDQPGAFWRFIDQSRRVAAALPDQPGFLGHSLRGSLLGTELWTMTAWSDPAALTLFIDGDEHRAAVRAALPVMARGRFVRFGTQRAWLPPRWSVALAALDGPEARAYTYP
jgi:heme-degrading monooxygenase HmoA